MLCAFVKACAIDIQLLIFNVFCYIEFFFLKKVLKRSLNIRSACLTVVFN